MRICKRGCFETNSSSMHSVVITNNTGNSTTGYYYEKDGFVSIYSNEMEFGRSPFHICRTVRDKTAYAVASFVYNNDKIEEIKNIYKNITGWQLDLEMERDEEYRRCDTGKEVYWYQIKWLDNGDGTETCVLKDDPDVEVEWRQVERVAAYVDHQSSDLLQRFLAAKNITLEDFIVSDRYMVIIDGDEYCEFNNLLSSGIVDKNNIKEIFS